MSEVFHCPHCQNQFPALPALVGRKVRCSHCGNIFMLQKSGVAVAIGQPTATPTATPAATPTASSGAASPAAQPPAAPSPTPAAMPSPPAVPAPAPAADKPASGSASLFESESDPMARAKATDEELLKLTRTWVDGDTMATKRRSAKQRSADRLEKPQRITSRADALRKSLRSNLQEAAAHAAASMEGSGPVDAAPHEKTNLSAIQVRLTDSGRQAARLRLLSLGILACCLVGALLLYLAFSGSHELVQVLERYADGGGGQASVTSRRERAWFATTDGAVRPLLISDPGSVTVHEPQRFALAELEAMIDAHLAGYEPQDRLGCFVHPADLPELSVRFQDPEIGWNILAKPIDKRRLRYVSYSEVVDLLRAAGISGDLLHHVSLALAGSAADPERSLRRRWLHGEMPVAMDVAILRGTDGLALQEAGKTVRAVDVPSYTAVLVRLLGPGYDEEWRVFDCYATDDPAHLENGLQVRQQLAGLLAR